MPQYLWDHTLNEASQGIGLIQDICALISQAISQEIEAMLSRRDQPYDLQALDQAYLGPPQGPPFLCPSLCSKEELELSEDEDLSPEKGDDFFSWPCSRHFFTRPRQQPTWG